MLTINLGNIYSRITYEQKDVKQLEKILTKYFRVEVPGAKYLWSYKNKSWNGLTDLWENSFDLQGNFCGIQIRTGLIPRFIREIEKTRLKWRSDTDSRNLPQTAKLGSTGVQLRPYQFEAIRTAFSSQLEDFGWHPRGVIEAACGAGKGEMIVAMFEMNPVPTFVLVHRKDLLIQAEERFKKYNHVPGVIGDSKFNPQNNLNIATMQTLKRIFEEKNTRKKKALIRLVNNCQQIFGDEIHIMASSLQKGNEFVEVCDQFPAAFRWGLSATPFLKTSFDNMLLEGVTGNLLYKITARELIEQGYLVPPKVIMKKVPGQLLISYASNWQRKNSNKNKTKYWFNVEEKGIKFNELRNNLILDEVEIGPFPLLILVRTIEQANFLNKLWELRENLPLTFLSGSDKSDVRKKAIKQLQEGSLKRLMSTSIFEVGVDIPNLRTVILASGGKSQVQTIQKLGRVLRVAPGKKEAKIVDFWDSHQNLLQKHSEARKKVYVEQGFKVVIER